MTPKDFTFPQRKNGVKDSAITRLIEAGEDEELVRNLTATMYAGT